jgi:tRNA(fMet)-specific endonuclease VapC
MLRYLLDTDHVTLFHHGHPQVTQRIVAQAPGAVGLAVVTVEEVLRGRLGALAQAADGPARIARYSLLLESLELLHQFSHVPFVQKAEDELQRLRAQKLRVGSQDLKIAAIALANSLVLATRNQRDFGRIPGLVLEDWSV